GEEHTGEAGDGARHGEGGQTGAGDVDSEGGRCARVVASGDEDTSAPVAPERPGGQQHDGEEGQTQVVVGTVAVGAQTLPEHRSRDARRLAPREDVLADPVLALEEVELHGRAEG